MALLVVFPLAFLALSEAVFVPFDEHGHLAAVSNVGSFVESSKAPLPMPKHVAWLHIRKSGTSFANALLHHKGLCPDWPEDIVLDRGNALKFWQEHPIPKLCQGGFSESYESPPGCAGIGNTFERNAGRVMGFFRQPEQRLISDYYYLSQERNSERKDVSRDIVPRRIKNDRRGCAVKTLARQFQFSRPKWHDPRGFPSEPCLHPDPPMESEVNLAVQRVSRMAFVGLTEEWALSICLFHAMYGGPCKRLEFVDSRRGPKHQSGGYDAKKLLRNWTDEFDGRVYAEATRVFWERVQEWGVSRDGCRRTCYSNEGKTLQTRTTDIAHARAS